MEGQEVVVYEREPMEMFDLQQGDNTSDFLICEVRMLQQRKQYLFMSSVQQIGYSRMHIFRKSWTAR